MYKLAFIDIDGTLLTSQHTISSGTYASIRRITELNNMIVVLTTARPPQAVAGLYNQLNLQTPVACFNGALVLEHLHHKNYTNTLKSITIEAGVLHSINNVLAASEVNVSYYKSGEWFSGRDDSWIKQEAEITGTKQLF